MIYLGHLSITPTCISFWGCCNSALQPAQPETAETYISQFRSPEFWNQAAADTLPVKPIGQNSSCPFWALWLPGNLWHSLACSPIAPICLHHHIVSSLCVYHVSTRHLPIRTPVAVYWDPTGLQCKPFFIAISKAGHILKFRMWGLQ